MDNRIIVRSKAPLRLGLAGGGTDVSPYSDQYGGCVLNATIDLYAHCTIELLEPGTGVEFVAKDLQQAFRSAIAPIHHLDGPLLLHKAVYNRLVHDFSLDAPPSLRVTTYSDALPGSGLGSSSTMVVAMIAAYRELLNLPLGEYDVAHLAFEIERKDCNLAGGKQDQYAATFGGFNFMEFYNDDKVIVNPLRIRRHVENELQAQLLLYFTGISRSSAEIIDDQIKTAQSAETRNSSVAAMHEVKRLAIDMKEAMLKGNINGIIDHFSRSWEAKKQMSARISSPHIEEVASSAISAGARAVKIAGAGGGGFMMIFADPASRIEVQQALNQFAGHCSTFHFTQTGVESWKVKC